MKSIIATRAAALSIALLASLPMAFADSADASPKPATPAAAEPADSTVVSKVTIDGKTFPITYGQVKDKLKLLPPQLQGSPKEIFPLLQKSEETAQIISYLAEKAGTRNDPEYQKMVGECQKGVLQKLFLDGEVKKMSTNEELMDAYNKVKEATKQEKEYNLSIITITDKAKAKKIFDTVNVTNFGEVANKESLNKTPDGSIGYMRLGDLPEPIREKLKKLQEANGGKIAKATKIPSIVEISMPEPSDANKKVTTYNIIMVQDVRDAVFPPFDDVKDQIQAAIAPDLTKKAIAKLQDSAKIERFTMDGKPIDEKADAPKADAPKADAPKADAPKATPAG
jgi:peptidyl-prolyl cis-trans isomerase C